MPLNVLRLDFRFCIWALGVLFGYGGFFHSRGRKGKRDQGGNAKKRKRKKAKTRRKDGKERGKKWGKLGDKNLSERE